MGFFLIFNQIYGRQSHNGWEPLVYTDSKFISKHNLDTDGQNLTFYAFERFPFCIRRKLPLQFAK